MIGCPVFETGLVRISFVYALSKSVADGNYSILVNTNIGLFYSFSIIGFLSDSGPSVGKVV